MVSEVFREHRKTLKLIKQKGGCGRCRANFGEHGISSIDKHKPLCPRRKWKKYQRKDDRWTKFTFIEI